MVGGVVGKGGVTAMMGTTRAARAAGAARTAGAAGAAEAPEAAEAAEARGGQDRRDDVFGPPRVGGDAKGDLNCEGAMLPNLSRRRSTR